MAAREAPMVAARSLIVGASDSESATACSSARPRSKVSELSLPAGRRAEAEPPDGIVRTGRPMSGLLSREDGAGHLGEPDDRAVLAGGGRGDHHGVAVLEERSGRPVVERHLVPAAPA